MKIKDFLGRLDEAEEDNKKTGFHTDIEKATVENDYFRKVLFTGPNSQLVVMSLKPGEDIGTETHNELDQFIRVDKGSGTAVIAGKEYELKDGSAFIITAGSEHNVTASEDEELKIYAVYTAPNHPDMVIDKTKADAQEREESE